MATQSSHPFGDYQKMAEQSLAAWQSLWSRAMDANPGGFKAEVSDAGMEHMLDGLKNYCTWLESVSSMSAAVPGGMRWDQTFAKTFGGNLGQPFMQAFGEMADMGPLGSEPWLQSLLGMAAPARRSLGGLLDLPAFGLAREHQEQAQHLGKAWLDYQEQSARYQNLIARVGRMATERLQDMLAERDAPGRQIESLRALYDLWVDAAEDVYAEVALSDEFREVYGDMVNAQMRVRNMLQKQVEESSAQLGVPTRSEVDSLGQRVQELRRHAAPGAMQSMRDELAQLRAEIAALRNEQRRGGGDKATTSKPKSKPAAKKAAAKKTVASKSAVKKPTQPARRK